VKTLSLLLIVFVSLLQGVEKVNYSFTADPIDVVIPCTVKDRVSLELCIEGIRSYGQGVRRIIVISEEKLSDNAEWFDERRFPFRKSDIALALFQQDRSAALEYMTRCANAGYNRLGWIYQQLLKLYALSVIPDISSNVLVLDADVIFLKPTSFIDADGSPFLTAAGEYFSPYFDHMRRLIPWMKRETNYSGISHHMLMQRCVMEDLFKMIEEKHQMPAWKALCLCIEPKNVYDPCLSEYEIYFNFLLARSDQAHVRLLKWDNIGSLKHLEDYRQKDYHYIAWHSWGRSGD
jgi:hypothetical protein